MIALLAVSPENELRVAQRLQDSMERAWPYVAASRRERIDILVESRRRRKSIFSFCWS